MLILLTALATGHVQSEFFRDAVIQREAVIVRDLAAAIAARDLRAGDLEQPGDAERLVHLQRRFAILGDLSGVVRIKVFNADQVVVWSDEATLVGRRIEADTRLTQAVTGGVAAALRRCSIPAIANPMPRTRCLTYR